MDEDLINKIRTIPNYQSLSDNKLDNIKSYEGNVDEFIQNVGKYGEDTVKSVIHYGNVLLNGGVEQFVKYKIDGVHKYTIQEMFDLNLIGDVTDLVESGEVIIN